MSLFKRKEKDNKSKSIPTMTSFDRIIYKDVKSNSDDVLYDVADTVLKGNPVLVNFDIDKQDANRMLAFLSGIVYSTEGRIFRVETRLFLLARKEEFEDGTLFQYVEDLK